MRRIYLSHKHVLCIVWRILLCSIKIEFVKTHKAIYFGLLMLFLWQTGSSAQHGKPKDRYDFFNKYQIENRYGFMGGLAFSPKIGHYFLNFDGIYHNRNKYGLKLNVGLPFATGISGSQNNSIAWDENESEVTSSGSYFYTTDIGVGYMAEIYIFATFGVAYQVDYKNAKREESTQGKLGNYYKTNFTKTTFNLGFEFGTYIMDDFLLGVNLSLIQGAGVKVGYLF